LSGKGKVTRKKLLVMLVMRALGYHQEEIGKELGVSGNTVKYYLHKIRKLTEREGVPLVFYSVVLGPLGAPLTVTTRLEQIFAKYSAS